MQDRDDLGFLVVSVAHGDRTRTHVEHAQQAERVWVSGGRNEHCRRISSVLFLDRSDPHAPGRQHHQ